MHCSLNKEIQIDTKRFQYCYCCRAAGFGLKLFDKNFSNVTTSYPHCVCSCKNQYLLVLCKQLATYRLEA